MKAIIFISLLLFSLQHCEAQKAVVAHLRMNVVEVGVSNPIDILVENYRCADLVVTTENGTITKLEEDCSYNYIPERQGIGRILISSKDGKFIANKDFRAKFIQEPIAVLCNKEGGILEKADLVRCPQIDAIVKGFDWDAGFRIQKYSAVILRQEDSVFVKNSIFGNLISNELKKAFNATGHRDKVVFYGITASGRDKRIHELSPMEFTITKK